MCWAACFDRDEEAVALAVELAEGENGKKEVRSILILAEGIRLKSSSGGVP